MVRRFPRVQGAPARSGLIAALALVATAASAQVTVFSGAATQATACSLAARHANASPVTIQTCTQAILSEPLSARDLAGTHVNRAVLYMVGADWSRVLIAERRYAEGVLEIDRGLGLRPEEPERAYYNRGLAKERLDDVKGAYYDYLKAAELAPTWAAPQEELKRFSVSPAPKG
jgi:tetratricopeptide (TPR) repeat protein